MQPAHMSVEDLEKFKMVVSLDDHDISRLIRENRWYSDEQFETAVFAEQLRPGMSVLDLGGNIGFYTMLSRSIVGPEGRVVVFEPYPRSASLIRASAEVNGYRNVDVVEAAVSDVDGKGKLFLSPDNWTEHSTLDLEHQRPDDDGLFSIEIPYVTVDAALERLGHDGRVDVMKMDIEGGEWRAIQGMKKVFANNPRMTLMTELWPNGFFRIGATPRLYLETLQGEGFSFEHMDHDTQEVYPVTLEEILTLVEKNANRTFEDPIMKVWGWYTNLLCKRG